MDKKTYTPPPLSSSSIMNYPETVVTLSTPPDDNCSSSSSCIINIDHHHHSINQSSIPCTNVHQSIDDHNRDVINVSDNVNVYLKTTTDTLQSRANNQQRFVSKLAFDRASIYHLAKQLSDDNRLYFQCISRSMVKQRFAAACQSISKDFVLALKYAQAIYPYMLKYDFDLNTPGNGYRSIVAVLDSCSLHLLRLLRDIKQQREYLLFRTNYFCKELEAYCSALRALRRDLKSIADNLQIWAATNDLFNLDDPMPELDIFMNQVESYDHSCFYGRCMGFQYASSLFRVFQIVGFGIASYSILWEKGASESLAETITGLFQSGRFALNPEERSQRITDVFFNADISFCKAFWNLTEGPFLQDLPKWFCPVLAINEVWILPAKEFISVESIVPGNNVKIPQPRAHSGPGPVHLRILSYKKRVGLSNPFNKQSTTGIGTCCQAKSSNLLFHCHGGGFVATSSRSHEIYLRHWAMLLDCTIVSVDYSLAPDNPYPRAVEEVLYAYAWVLKNADRLGWTGEKVCFAGDSAGGHILMSITLRSIQMNMKRLPDGLVLIYTPFLIEYSASPSRLLSFIDPLLPPGIMARCMAAYVGSTETVSNKEGCIVKSPITSSRLTLAEYEFNLKSNIDRFSVINDPNAILPEYEVNLNTNQTTLTNYNASLKNGNHNSIRITMVDDRTLSESSNERSNVEESKFSTVVSKQTDCSSFQNINDNQLKPQHLSTKNTRQPIDNHSLLPDKTCKNDATLSLKRLACPQVARQRSRSDTIVNFSLHDRKSINNLTFDETSNVDQSINDFNQNDYDNDANLFPSRHDDEIHDETVTVRIKKDPRRIVVLAGSYANEFIDYLTQHEMVGKSLIRFRVPSCSSFLSSIRLSKNVDGKNTTESSTSSFTYNDADVVMRQRQYLHNRYSPPPRRCYSTSSLSCLTDHVSNKLKTVKGYLLEGLSFLTDNTSATFKDTNDDEDDNDYVDVNYDDVVVFDQKSKQTFVNHTTGVDAPPSTPVSKSFVTSFNRPRNSSSTTGSMVPSRLAHFRSLIVPRDPILSPMRADDSLLAKLPKVTLIANHLDPLLDDSVTFAKRLRRNNVNVSLDLLDGLPHGFLNFTIFSPECRIGAKQCIERIKDVFEHASSSRT